MKKLFSVLGLASLLCMMSCGQGAKQESDEQARLDSIKAAQEQAIKDSIEQAKADSIQAEEKKANDEETIVAELTKLLKHQETKAVFSKEAAKAMEEYAFGEMQCPASKKGDCPFEDECGPLYDCSESPSLKIEKVGEDSYKVSAMCPCGCKQYDSFRFGKVVVLEDGTVEIRKG